MKEIDPPFIIYYSNARKRNVNIIFKANLQDTLREVFNFGFGEDHYYNMNTT